MERGPNLNDPRLKTYLDSLDPKYRNMVEELYGQQTSNIKLEQLRQLVNKRKEEGE